MFKVNQKIVCIKTHVDGFTYIKDEIYTISQILTCCKINLVLNEVKLERSFRGCRCKGCAFRIESIQFCDSQNFRPIDYTFGEKLAEEIQEEINQENLVNA